MLIFTGIIIMFLSVLMLIMILNRVLLNSTWYRNLLVDYDHEVFPDDVWCHVHSERNYDLINIGSSSAVYAFDYAGHDVKAMNWARQPQTLLYDIRLVKNFHWILKEGGYVLISIMPFTSINKMTGIADAIRYSKTISSEFQEEKYRRKAVFLSKYPIFIGEQAFKEAVKAVIGYHQNQKKWQQPNDNNMSEDDLLADASRWDENWRQQFAINDYKDPLTEVNFKGRQLRIMAMRDLIDFCSGLGYKPVYVILPISKYLSYYLHDEFMNKYIYEYLEQVGRDVPILDFSHDKELAQLKYYANAYFLNKKGARKFTAKVLKELGFN